jgi:GWxTD domain-containing protein
MSFELFAQDKISFEFDYAKFNYDSTKTYLELYYSIGQSDLNSYVEENNNFIGAYLDVTIIDTTSKKILVQNRYLSRSALTSKNDSTYKGKNLLGSLGFILNSGFYSFIITATDIGDPNKSLTYKEVVTIDEFQIDRYVLSDIQLATRIISDSKKTKSIFYKNTMEVFPNPHNIYTEQMPVLFFYAELYNLNLSKYESKNLVLIQQLSDSYGNPLNVKKKALSKNNKSVVEAGVINLKKYPSGSYTLLLSVFEDSVNIGISTAKRFYLINPSVVAKKVDLVGNMDIKSSEFGIFSEEECDELFEVSEPIALRKDFETYESLRSIESKREFLFNFWKVRDQIPETIKNEFKEEYLERVRFVDIRYKTFVKRGVKTDRGRTYMKYGEPDELDKHPNEYDMKPYEVWNYYSIEGGVVFIFGDVTGYNNYELLHSTKRGEMRDESWQRRIKVD